MGTPPPEQAPVDHAQLQLMLGSPELGWLVDRIRNKLERGEPLDGTVTLVEASPAQRKAAMRLLGRSAGHGPTLSVPLPALAAELRRTSAAPSLLAAVEALGGPVRNRAAERAAELRHWAEVLARARSSPLAGLDWYRQWLDDISRDGTITRLVRQGHGEVIDQAATVLALLPSEDRPPAPDDSEPVRIIGSELGSVLLTALAAQATGDENALSEGPLPGLVLRALAVREGVQAPAGREGIEALWSAAGVATDDLASQVLVLNMRAGGEPLGRWLSEAADAGQPFRATLRQLTGSGVLPWALDVFVCASSAVLRAAADRLGADCPALVCTEGLASVACTRLLHAAASSGSTVHWHADFSWPGLRATATAIRRLGAQPWLMSVTDYEAAVADGGGEPLKGWAEPSPWDPRLAELMRSTGRAVSEEHLQERLLTELIASRVVR